ncbi:MAG: biotin--[acetyl-CoA-carboxylase] ligase [Phenylobacterium sp.]|uniref:biotin--[acetyl-CoA-carboxylase] ligase n=1 Tax=Phenylobacterium sp. TaxID=1871053 RepID=UPI0025F9DA88|nr:biotin--[acetyl-CoA-carboxylase] ligase [Phenylobacterium sp.]MCA3731054.1 biotin--[acetyl-CoA-carboxylase] ligase [Phenylobacterium sp.]
MSAPPIESYAVLDSTNAEARRRAEAGLFGPVWIHALEQTAGRGRRGRAWCGGGGNLAATLLIPGDLPPAQAAQISFVAAVALCETVNALAGPGAARLRWPNDLYTAGGKVAGILVESGARPGGGLWLAVGIGVNLAEAPPRDQVERPAAALADIPGFAPQAPADFLAALANRFESWRRIWVHDGFPPVGEAWTRMAEGLGGPCTARLPDRTLSGTAEALESDGALRLRLENGEVVRVTAGEVFFGET